MQTITLLGKAHTITLPGPPDGYMVIEELLLAWTKADKSGDMMLVARANCAMIGMTTRIGRLSGADYRQSHQPLVYGGAVYTWLAGEKADPTEVAVAATKCLEALLEARFSRDTEVKAAEDFTPAPGERKT